MMLTLIVGLALGGAAVYMAYRDQKLGTAIVVGLSVVTVFVLLMDKDPSAARPQPESPSPPASTFAPPQAPPAQSEQPTP
ncbi:hypothetical protein [Streptomyces sp. NPDC046925]|uniref:hypothetical protein n=1 Tax=Streptomyces sp. NPDC046925 TaxID=3155375 RepID=UPI0033D86625